MKITKFSGNYAFLSNFWQVTVDYDREIWPSAEHAYQAAKFNDPAKTELILANPDPRAAKKYGKAKGLRPDWDEVKVDIMRAIVTAKFDQHHMLAEQLRLTKPHELVEGNWWGDTFWGVCNGKGENWLGKILMEIREKL